MYAVSESSLKLEFNCLSTHTLERIVILRAIRFSRTIVRQSSLQQALAATFLVAADASLCSLLKRLN